MRVFQLVFVATLTLMVVSDAAVMQSAFGQTQDAALPMGEGDLALFGGAIEFELPAGWHAAEVPLPREIRLVLSPPVVAGANSAEDVVWIAYHHRGRMLSPQELESLLETRIRLTTGRDLPMSEINTELVGAMPALAREFTANGFRGKHWIVPTEWGAIELHLTAPANQFQQRLVAVQGIRESMEIGTPDDRLSKTDARYRDAESAVGLWKGLQGRMRLTGDGRVVVRADRRAEYAIDAAGNLNYTRQVPQLTGHYLAEGDLLRITWEDGSQLNYRWSYRDGELLLTDHLGRVSQLTRHFD